MLRLLLPPGRCSFPSFHPVDQLGSGGPYALKRRFQHSHVLVPAPARNIGKGIVRCVDTQVLTHHIGDALGLHLAGCPAWPFFGSCARGKMELCMSNLMDQRFDSLLLAHIWLYYDALLRIAAIMTS